MLEGTRRAVIVGINEYQDKSIPALTGAENDARELYERLRDPNIGNFEIPDNHCLIGSNATCERIRAAISDVFWKTEPCDLALFYFSGHGLVYGPNDGYIAPYDFSVDSPFVCGANITELKRVFSRPHIDSAIIILDCCYSGVATQGEKAVSDYKADYESNLEALSGEGRIIFASSSSDQRSRECNQKHNNEEHAHPHGAFTFQLLQGLDGSASENEEGIISLTMLQNHLERQFQGNKDQTPRFFTEGSNLGAIKLALATRKYNENLNAKIARARAHLDRKTFLNLVQATKEAESVLIINAKQKESIDLKLLIIPILEDYRNQMLKWLSDNNFELQVQLPNVFDELDILLDKLDFSMAARLSGRSGNLLGLLSRVVFADLTKEQFVIRCKPFDNPDSLPQSLSLPR